MKAILSNFMKLQIVKGNEIDEIDISNPANYIKLENVYHGAIAESIYIKNSEAITQEELQECRINVLNFYVRVLKEMMKRFLSSNMLSNLEQLDPANVSEGKPMLTMPLVMPFPDLVNADQ